MIFLIIVLSFIIGAFLISIIMAIVIRLKKKKWPEWSGFGPYIVSGSSPDPERGKTLWDLLGILAVPIAVSIIAFLFSDYQSRIELKVESQRATSEYLVETDRYREESLQKYFDQMAVLLLDYGLKSLDTSQSRESAVEEGIDLPIPSTPGIPMQELSPLARARTLTVLSELDGNRKAFVIRFLYDSGLISSWTPVIDLKYADLSEVNLEGAELIGANFFLTDLPSSNFTNAKLTNSIFRLADLTNTTFQYADLRNSYFENSFLSGADFSYALLEGASFLFAALSEADFTGAILIDADFTNAIVDSDQLMLADDLSGCIFPNGDIYLGQ